jgi:curli biogenesis system outer membrane secretion channel CsgG
MKKLILAFAVVLTTAAFTSCQKESVAPTAAKASYKVNVMADKANLGQADFTEAPTTPPAGDKANLGQADYNGN